MNDDQFEQLLQQTETSDPGKVARQVDVVIAEHRDQLSEGQRVDLLYLEYLIRHAGGDGEAIDDLCRRYPELAAKLIRQTEVDTELSSLDDETELPRPATESQASLVGNIGDYTVVEKIGEGAQAEVFRVVHPMLRCELAMKVGKHANDAADRILDEGRLLVTFNDPGIARVIDAGVWRSRPFIVSELIRGTTFKQRIDDGTLSQTQLVEALVTLARTVEKLHDAGILHCDIKATNVLVSAEGTPKLVDFGLAIDRSEDAWDERASFREDHLGGTLVYMAPELFTSANQSGGAKSRQPACDVFSLGGLLFFGLVGNHAYASASPKELIGRVATGDWDRQALRECGAPLKLIGVCESAMAADPKSRTQSAAAFAYQLQQWLDRSSSRSLVTKVTAGIAVAMLAFVGWFVLQHSGGWSDAILPLASLPATVAPDAERFGQLDIKIWSEDRVFELVNRVPIESGDGLQINAPLRAGRIGELWLLASDGKVERLASFAAEDSSRWVHYPAELDQAVPLTGLAGSEAIVWLESRRSMNTRESTEPSVSFSAEEVARALRPRGSWPPMDDAMVIRLVDGALQFEQEDRSLGQPQAIEAPLAMIQTHLRQAAAELEGMGIDAEIVAFSHAE